MSLEGWVETPEGWVLFDEIGEPKKRLPLGDQPPESELSESDQCPESSST